MSMRLLSWNLRHRRWRLVLDALTMAFTVAVVMLFVSVLGGMKRFLDSAEKAGLTRIIVLPKIITSSGALPISLHRTLQQIEGAQVVQAFFAFAGQHESGATYDIHGEEVSGVELNTDFFPVDPAELQVWKSEPTGALVTEATAKELRLTIGQVVEVPTNFGPMQIKIVGLSRRATVPHRIVVHHAYAREFLKNPESCYFRVFTKPADFKRVAAAIIEQTKISAMPAQPMTSEQAAASWLRQGAVVPSLLGFLGLFLIIVTGLTLANSAAIAIRERRIETATLRMIGFQKSVIWRLLLGESLVVGVVGGLAALVVMMLVFRGGIEVTPGFDRMLPPVTITTAAAIAGLVTSFVIPLIGTIPSTRAALRTPLADALRDGA